MKRYALRFEGTYEGSRLIYLPTCITTMEEAIDFVFNDERCTSSLGSVLDMPEDLTSCEILEVGEVHKVFVGTGLHAAKQYMSKAPRYHITYAANHSLRQNNPQDKAISSLLVIKAS